MSQLTFLRDFFKKNLFYKIKQPGMKRTKQVNAPRTREKDSSDSRHLFPITAFRRSNQASRKRFDPRGETFIEW